MEYFGQGALDAWPNGPPQSAALPRDFVYNYADSPKTPEPMQIIEPPQQPPNPPKVRIKRRRGPIPPFEPLQTENFEMGEPVPTIELPDSRPAGQSLLQEPMNETAPALTSSSRLQSLQPLISPPKTPILREPDAIGNRRSGVRLWAQKSSLATGQSISRPSSALSDLSDSSASSTGSSMSPRSVGDSCTSPESEATDPFVFPKFEEARPALSSPVQFDSSQSRKRRRTEPNVKWTTELDEHLWITYLTYLSDPTVTPFKMLPGTAPPLGVCHRVARQAKKTWRGPRPSLLSISELDPSGFQSLDAHVLRHSSLPPDADSPDTLRPPPWRRSHSSNEMRKAPAKWPKSGSSTRRRLRELCKRRPALSPHYSRLMKNRSPSPFESSSSQPRSRSNNYTSPPPSRSDAQSAFSTRDLHFNLATSTAASMQPSAPLSQLMSEAQTPRADVFNDTPRPYTRSPAHQKSQSLQIGLEIGTAQSSELRRLASPFKEHAGHHTWSQRGSSSSTLRQPEHAQGPTLDSPLEIHAPRPMSGSMKRRAQYQLGDELVSEDLGARRNFLEDLFRDPITNGNRRVRSRGFSLGAMRHAPPSMPLAELFTPPSTQEQEQRLPTFNLPETPHVAAVEGGRLHPPRADHVNRLGSPFAPRANASFSNTFPRSLFPNGLDSIAAFEQQNPPPHSQPPPPSLSASLSAYHQQPADEQNPPHHRDQAS